MKVEIEFELLKDEPKIVDLIAGRVYALDCVDKPKDVKARVVEPVEKNQCDGCAVGAPINKMGNHRYEDGSLIACTKSRYEGESLVWPTLTNLITLPVIEMKEEVKP